MSGRLRRLFRGETNIDFIGRRALWFGISGLLLLVSVAAIFLRPTETPCRSPLPQGLNCGIEFNGGLSLTAPVPRDGPLGDADDERVIADVSDAVQDAGVPAAQVQVAEREGERDVLVQTRTVSNPEARDRVRAAVSDAVGASPADTAFESISAKWGGEITAKAVRALVVFLVIILAFISWRFEFKMALSAIAALIHDMTITAGVYALVGFEITPSTVIALLTILGYSLYDTVVVFDKLEENTERYAATGRMTYDASANLALNQVFMRSLNTSLTTLLPIAALLFVGAGLLGASTLEDLALALLIGILVGAYSSVFFATPLLASLKEREPRYRSVRERVLRDAARAERRPGAAAAPAPGDGAATADDDVERVGAAAPATAPAPSTRPSARPRAGDKKARRRKRR
ncbi:MAG TPA: protein translocase subunit SecF [Actinomycetota bacterium]|nr:protein translocase subunit SecF [Actinomycetota bacterium]